MFPGRPGRMPGFTYVGLHRYSLTMCTFQRQPAFRDSNLVASVLLTIRTCAAKNTFEVIAYCFMPDHLHLVAGAASEASDLQRFVSQWKQLTGYSYKRSHGQRLWQESYFDHVLRDDEETWRAARYVLENPVRKGFVKSYDEYPFCGSDKYSAETLRDLWFAKGQG
jgi:putative transposase